MKITKFTHWLLALAAASLVILLSLLPAQAQENTGFTEGFDQMEPPGWELPQGATIQDGMLKLDPGGAAFRHGQWSDFTLDVRVQFSGQGDFLIRYCAVEGTGYNLIFRPDQIALEKGGQEPPQSLATAPFSPPQAGSWLDLRLSVSSGQHTLLINGSQVLAAADPVPLPAGGLAFQAMGGLTASIDSVTLSVGGEAPPAEVPAAGGEVPPAGGAPAVGGEQTGAAATPPGGSQTATAPATGNQSVDNLINGLLNWQPNQIDLVAFVINLLLAAATSFILSRVYIYWGSSLSNRRKFAANFMLISVTTTFIILIVRSSVALSLGLVGALSIVRFRAAIKEPEELAYLYFAVGLGIGLGDNQRLITLLALAAGVALIGLARLLRRRDADVNLHLTIASQNPHKVDLEQVLAALKPHCAALKLMRLDENETAQEMAFLVEFRDMKQLRQARAALQNLSEFIEISFLDNKGIW